MSATRVVIALGLLLLLPRRAWAQEVPDAGAGPARPDESGDAEPPGEAEGRPDTKPAPVIGRPTLLRNAEPSYPPEAWAADIEADVVVTLTLDIEGKVVEVEPGEPVGHGFDEAALAAARKLLFSPATVDGVPVPVQIRFTFRFRKNEKASEAAPPPAPDQPPQDSRKPVTIKVTLYERGKGKRLQGVEVYLLDRDEVILTDERGQFDISGPPGAYAFTIRPPGFYPYMATERLEEGEEVELNYYVRRRRRDRYSTIVWGSEGRAEVARTSLADDEIRTVAGTMGDPIRVATLLPGASSSVSGLGYPIVRGSLPGDSLYEIDGIRIPMLYHLLFGPAVVHPRFVDEIVFQPGGYSAKHGRFPGARIGATTARVDEDPTWVADLNIVETSLFRSQKLPHEGEMVAAVRYGTLGYIIEGLAANTVFRYWDYQSRLSYRLPNEGKLSLTLLGASDAAGESDPDTGREEVLQLGFHTADLRYQHGWGRWWAKLGVQLSHEFFESPDADTNDDGDIDSTTMNALRPYGEIGVAQDELEAAIGFQSDLQDFGLLIADDDFIPFDWGLSSSLWTSVEWSRDALVLAPSLRVDHYAYRSEELPGRPRDWTTQVAVDPRLSGSYRLQEGLTVKGSLASHSGPSRFSFSEPPIVFGPIPGFEGPGLEHGLQRSRQAQLGVEGALPGDLELQLTGYYRQTDIPIDFSLIDKRLEADPTPCDGEPSGDESSPFDIEGRSYGAELMLRRRLGRSLFGWASYALSRSERDIPGVGTLPFDFDQTHVFNGVLSWEVGRNWTLGGVVHLNTGRPYAPLIVDQCLDGGDFFQSRRGDANSERLPTYWRVDFRVQKREVFDTWFFDFYIDFFNAAFQFETIDYEVDPDTGEVDPVTVPLFVPMIGIRGEF